MTTSITSPAEGGITNLCMNACSNLVLIRRAQWYNAVHTLCTFFYLNQVAARHRCHGEGVVCVQVLPCSTRSHIVSQAVWSLSSLYSKSLNDDSRRLTSDAVTRVLRPQGAIAEPICIGQVFLNKVGVVHNFLHKGKRGKCTESLLVCCVSMFEPCNTERK